MDLTPAIPEPPAEPERTARAHTDTATVLAVALLEIAAVVMTEDQDSSDWRCQLARSVIARTTPPAPPWRKTMTPGINESSSPTDPAYWTARVVWTTREGGVFHESTMHKYTRKPQTGDIRLVIEDAIDQRDLARGRHTLMAFNTSRGMPIAINPDDVDTVQVEVVDPNGVDRATELDPGYLDDDDYQGQR